MSNSKSGAGITGNLRNLYDKARLLVSDDRPPRFPTPMAPMNPPSLPIPLSLMSMEHQETLELLLKPIAEDMPCGPALRYDPIFTEIRLAREEDDPSLPMGEWERPLKRADWPLIESRCKAMLGSRSKDLQIAVWLLEAWTRQDAFDGLYRGLSLVDRLVRQFWEPLHPTIQDDDADARVAPLEWLNGAFATTVRLHMPLIRIANRKPPGLTLADWEAMTARELAAGGHVIENAEAGEAPMTRQEVIGYAQQRLGRDLALKQQILRRCINCLETMLAFLDLQLGSQSPNLSKLKAVLVAIERVLVQLAPEQEEEEMPMIQEMREEEVGVAAGAAEPVVALSGWKNRHEAYATLSALADYLSLVEPHSPTPYLLRRAVNWGRMPLPELMAEIIREEGDLNRLVNMLGLKE
ncbi:type VI secretion system protein TssA [Duganella aceris]|jgi:type VI secretion system protein ImpA|uniref:Type VI secretion system protein TssA n=1 Tax=Duganella aceris TaxID=2703883 RepID=A0ABX0FNC8_9BURK|nr:type VI secretion system protein TssA [Duganella aceris]NGZ86039.1 type VI secretion system protein TssA [Duganella aceris]